MKCLPLTVTFLHTSGQLITCRPESLRIGRTRCLPSPSIGFVSVLSRKFKHSSSSFRSRAMRPLPLRAHDGSLAKVLIATAVKGRRDPTTGAASGSRRERSGTACMEAGMCMTGMHPVRRPSDVCARVGGLPTERSVAVSDEAANLAALQVTDRLLSRSADSRQGGDPRSGEAASRGMHPGQAGRMRTVGW
jgi:hypothetical protein